MDWSSFVLGVGASLTAAVIFAAIASLWLWISGKMSMSLSAVLAGVRFLARLQRLGLSNFYSRRADYVRYRGSLTLGEYLCLAEEHIVLVGLWMAHGIEIQGVKGNLASLLEKKPNLRIQIALLKPTSKACDSLAQFLGLDRKEVAARISQALQHLYGLKDTLQPESRSRLDIRVYDFLPAYSLIVLDPESENCRVQIDIKLYHQPREKSMSLEFRGRGRYMVDLLRNVALESFLNAEPFDS